MTVSDFNGYITIYCTHSYIFYINGNKYTFVLYLAFFFSLTIYILAIFSHWHFQIYFLFLIAAWYPIL